MRLGVRTSERCCASVIRAGATSGSDGPTVGERSIEKKLLFASNLASDWKLKVWTCTFKPTSDLVLNM